VLLDGSASVLILRRRSWRSRWIHRWLIPVVVDLDATLVGPHSEEERATPNFKRRFGFHLLLAFIDHSAYGSLTT
jgi:hypothetical protein